MAKQRVFIDTNVIIEAFRTQCVAGPVPAASRVVPTRCSYSHPHSEGMMEHRLDGRTGLA